MFRDYYTILEISQNASHEEIKAAFKHQAMTWHPDTNLGIDTTLKMQLINEAKLILLDTEARSKYDVEYKRYMLQKQKQTAEQNQKYERGGVPPNQPFAGNDYEQKGFETEYSDKEYRVYDEELHHWMNNAKRQSVDLAKKTIEDFKGMIKVGAKAAGKEAFGVLKTQIVIGLIISFFILLSRVCNQ
jgi:DnaJ-class molecular chaperone